MLTNKFEGFKIKKSRVHEFMRNDCNLSMKQTTCWPEARTSKENVQKRYEWVVKWSNTDMDFSRNCIFIDEAGFDINMRASRAWAPREQMAVTTTPTTKALSHTVLGALSSVGVVNLSIRVPKQPPKFWALVKRKVRREKLQDTETLQDRIIDAANEVSIDHLRNIVQHSKNQFDNCLNYIPI
ncbi:hypothetical protein G6F46_010114 [Rhizopus delemar]|uniref:Tc1-like transposase DDE domain-containing protein n=2 Tax=Rhizopus TaxID=4842 RepID=A0A9P7CM12_9FUNG|nr:hypothetical protein G6F55_008941 [Rhizopus delemar]KAG1540422.1 hypothetical protein G6F51_008536 [Rhizopus arrhizus]KAG1494642.1 hypothetical protein G6F54_007736 [Rhizopus delemar]KAG1507049.1 hypothetical protein G6F52_011733 [Rhizopus delemar]KAG1508701.1 hypothetical protein G6F53_007998 [Rhizopus delemar]